MVLVTAYLGHSRIDFQPQLLTLSTLTLTTVPRNSVCALSLVPKLSIESLCTRLACTILAEPDPSPADRYAGKGSGQLTIKPI